MKTQRLVFQKKKLVIAVGVAIMTGAMVGCSSDDAAVAAAGEYAIAANGGVGGADLGVDGGEGGFIWAENKGGTGGVDISTSGAANTRFTTPIKPPKNADTGSNPLAIAADTTILYIGVVVDGGGTVLDENYMSTFGVVRVGTGGVAIYATDVVAAAGTDYFTNLSSGVFTTSGSAGTADAAYTGLSVAAAATLTLGDGTGGTVNASFTDDIDNEGTITKTANGSNLNLYANNYFATGNVSNVGIDTNTAAGRVQIYAGNGIVNEGNISANGFDNSGVGAGGDGDEIRLDAGGYVINSGALNASGGDGMGAGGDGDDIRLYGAYVENTASITAIGGNNTDVNVTGGNGGDGARIYMESDYVTYNSGDIDLSGGDGDAGGDGDTTSRIENNDLGEVFNSGNVTINGGAGENGAGGDAGDLDFTSYGGDLRNSGNFTANGGATTEDFSDGGDGGEVEFVAYDGDNATPNGDIAVSGNMTLNGGAAVTTDQGGTGGDGGEMVTANSGAEGGQKVGLLGYVSIDANGGDGGEGGSGGEFNVWATPQWIPAEQKYAVGSADNQVAINTTGGDAINAVDGGEGGDGGFVEIAASTSSDIANENAKGSNSGDIDTSGGAGVYFDGGEHVGGRGGAGSVDIEGYHGASNSGDVTANGGDGAEYGGRGGNLYIYSVSGAAKNSGDVTASGGDGAEYGAEGGALDVFGASASNSGDVIVDGGNTTDPADVYLLDPAMTMFEIAGDGGESFISGAGLKGASNNSGDFSYAGGTSTDGGEGGEDGNVTVGITCEGTCN